MITWKQAREGIRVRSSKRLPLEDQDAGCVIDHNRENVAGHEVLVAWDSGTRNWTTRDALFPES